MLQIGLDDERTARRLQVSTGIQRITSDVHDWWERNSMDAGCHFIPNAFSSSQVGMHIFCYTRKTKTWHLRLFRCRLYHSQGK